MEITERIECMLFDMGVNPVLKGFNYLVAAVKRVAEGKATNICIDIYESVAKEFNTTPVCVERNIRTVISKIDIESINLKCDLKNSEVIYALAFMLKKQEEKSNE